MRDPALYQVVKTSHRIGLNTQEAFLLLDLLRLAVRQGIRLLCPFRGRSLRSLKRLLPKPPVWKGEGRQGNPSGFASLRP